MRPIWLRELLRRPGGLYGGIVLGLTLLAAVIAPFWTPYELLAQDIPNAWQPPSPEHWLGTDRTGRDIFSWLLAGSVTTVLVAAGSVILAAIIGIVLASIGASAPRWLSDPLITLIDIMVAFPVLMIAMLLAAGFGGSLAVVVIAVGIGVGVNLARVLRPEIRRVITSDYVLAARTSGLSAVAIVRSHVLPNVSPVLVVQLSLVASVAVLAEAGLSFLGFGAPRGTPSWGQSLAESQQYIGVAPLSVLWPGLTITLVVLALTLFGDALREALDPRLRRTGRAPQAKTPSVPTGTSSAWPSAPSAAPRNGGEGL